MKTYRVVSLEPYWLVGCKICQVYPVPGCDQHILAFDITMAHTPLMTLSQGVQQLKCNPVLQQPDSGYSASIAWQTHQNQIR